MEKLENLENKLRTALKYPNVIFPVLKKKDRLSSWVAKSMYYQCIINHYHAKQHTMAFPHIRKPYSNPQ